MFGTDSDIQYNHMISEALLLSEENMMDEALNKLTESIEWIY